MWRRLTSAWSAAKRMPPALPLPMHAPFPVSFISMVSYMPLEDEQYSEVRRKKGALIKCYWYYVMRRIRILFLLLQHAACVQTEMLFEIFALESLAKWHKMCIESQVVLPVFVRVDGTHIRVQGSSDHNCGTWRGWRNAAAEVKLLQGIREKGGRSAELSTSTNVSSSEPFPQPLKECMEGKERPFAKPRWP